MKKLAIVFALTVGLNQSTFATSQSFEDYHQGNYSAAQKGLEKLVKNKNKNALFYYGLMKLNGYAVKKNTDEALSLIKQSANKGNIKAQLFLANYSLTIAKNSTRAFYWFKKAADKGEQSAQLLISGAYKLGFGVKKNDRKESRYLIKAAKNGSEVAQYYLGQRFIKKHTYQSERLGISWLKKSAKKNHIPAMYDLVKIYNNNYKKRQYWLEKLKNNKTPEADYYIGKYFLSLNDLQVKKSSLKWLKASSDKGYIEATYALGILHQSGDLNLLNDKQAFNEISKAANQGYLPAQVQLSHMYKKGIGTPINSQLSSSWLKKHSINNYASKKNKLLNWSDNGKKLNHFGDSYHYSGILNNWSDKKAIKNGALNQSPKMSALTKKDIFQSKLVFTNPIEINTYLLADTIKLSQSNDDTTLPIYTLKNKNINAAQVKETYSRALLGNRKAQFILGQYHEFGIGVDKNLNAAAQWYFSSAKQNYLPAEYNLGLAFLYGQGVKQNLTKASYWLNRTAFKGNEKAQYALGIIYQKGFKSKNLEQNIPLDKKQSDLMYHLASGAGNPQAMFHLANQYAKQKLTLISSPYQQKLKHKEIMALYEQAFNQGIKEAKLPLAVYYLHNEIAIEKQKWAFKVLQNQVKSAKPQISLLLALMYERGIGTPQNMAEAIKWYKVAANNNLSAAQFTLGSYYYLGSHVNKNKLKAESLLRKAAKNSLAFANYNLAVIQSDKQESTMLQINKAAKQGYVKAQLYLADKELKEAKSPDKAALIYKNLAKKGNETAQLKLGFMYQKGLYFKKNIKKAKQYYLQAASKNNPEAQFQLGYLEQVGLDGSPNINAALNWYKKSANNNFTPAMLALGYLFETTHGDYKTANNWYQKTALTHNKIAQYNQALLLDYGKGVAQNNNKAKTLYLSAAKANFLAAKLNLANLYFENIDNPSALKKAFYWFSKASKDNSANAQYQLANMYEVGLGTPININKALEYYQKSANHGNVDAIKSLARLHHLNLIKESDQKKAFNYYKKSASKGDLFSSYQMANLLIHGIGTQKSEKTALKILNSLASKKFMPAIVMLRNITFINKTKLDHKKEISVLKKKAKKEGESVISIPKMIITLKQPIDKVAFKLKKTPALETPEAMYLTALKAFEQGHLYQSRAMLSKIVAQFPEYMPAKLTFNHIEEQDKKIKQI